MCAHMYKKYIHTCVYIYINIHRANVGSDFKNIKTL